MEKIGKNKKEKIFPPTRLHHHPSTAEVQFFNEICTLA
jgi:hypothetical protein